jgi:hypothetical protein
MAGKTKLEKVEKRKHGGRRQGSGRKPLLSKEEIARVKAIIEQHAMQIDETDKQKRERILRLLDVLYAEGVKKHNVPAIKEYLDRQLGKAKERVEMTGANGAPLVDLSKAIKQIIKRT